MKVQLNDIRHPDTHGGKEPKNHSPAFDFCRRLLGEGVSPLEPLKVYRGEQLAYTVSSIGWGATKKITEDVKRGPFMSEYKPNPWKLARQAEKTLPIRPQSDLNDLPAALLPEKE